MSSLTRNSSNVTPLLYSGPSSPTINAHVLTLKRWAAQVLRLHNRRISVSLNTDTDESPFVWSKLPVL
jgi:hypothetical protein